MVMMGANREQLKERLVSELQMKIETTRDALKNLQGAQASIHKNNFQAKADVQSSFEELNKIMAARKLELMNKIDELANSQVSFVQESIQSTLLALGSLQCTLANLDSFDLNQLANLHIPDYDWVHRVKGTAPLSTNLNLNDIKGTIETWGSISSSGLNQGQSQEATGNKTPTSDHESDFIKVDLPKNLSSFLSTNLEKKDSNELGAPLFQTFKCLGKCPNADSAWDIEKWLSCQQKAPCMDIEDFEMLSIDSDEKKPASTINQLQEACQDEDLHPQQEQGSTSMAHEEAIDEDDSSSIVTLSPGDETSSDNDIKKWLKVRRVPLPSHQTSVLSSMAKETLEGIISAAKENYSGTRARDFDTKTWLSKRRVKGLEDLNNRHYSTSNNLCLSMSQKEIIPPSFALPHLFWLKRC